MKVDKFNIFFYLVIWTPLVLIQLGIQWLAIADGRETREGAIITDIVLVGVVWLSNAFIKKFYFSARPTPKNQPG